MESPRRPEVRGRLPSEHVLPARTKRAAVEIAQACDLDIERLSAAAGPCRRDLSPARAPKDPASDEP